MAYLKELTLLLVDPAVNLGPEFGALGETSSVIIALFLAELKRLSNELLRRFITFKSGAARVPLSEIENEVLH